MSRQTARTRSRTWPIDPRGSAGRHLSGKCDVRCFRSERFAFRRGPTQGAFSTSPSARDYWSVVLGSTPRRKRKPGIPSTPTRANLRLQDMIARGMTCTNALAQATRSFVFFRRLGRAPARWRCAQSFRRRHALLAACSFRHVEPPEPPSYVGFGRADLRFFPSVRREAPPARDCPKHRPSRTGSAFPPRLMPSSARAARSSRDSVSVLLRLGVLGEIAVIPPRAQGRRAPLRMDHRDSPWCIATRPNRSALAIRSTLAHACATSHRRAAGADRRDERRLPRPEFLTLTQCPFRRFFKLPPSALAVRADDPRVRHRHVRARIPAAFATTFRLRFRAALAVSAPFIVYGRRPPLYSEPRPALQRLRARSLRLDVLAYFFGAFSSRSSSPPFRPPLRKRSLPGPKVAPSRGPRCSAR